MNPNLGQFIVLLQIVSSLLGNPAVQNNPTLNADVKSTAQDTITAAECALDVPGTNCPDVSPPVAGEEFLVPQPIPQFSPLPEISASSTVATDTMPDPSRVWTGKGIPVNE